MTKTTSDRRAARCWQIIGRFLPSFQLDPDRRGRRARTDPGPICVGDEASTPPAREGFRTSGTEPSRAARRPLGYRETGPGVYAGPSEVRIRIPGRGRATAPPKKLP